MTTRDRLVTPHVALAREEWRRARRARQAGWPDVAVRLEDRAVRHMSVARWVKRERQKAGVYGRAPVV